MLTVFRQGVVCCTALLWALCAARVAWADPVVNPVNQTVTDSVFNLEWDQCPLGLSGAGCGVGVALQLSWAEAQQQAAQRNMSRYKGYSDWRVPSSLELGTLVRSGAAPTIDTTVFPNTPASSFWTSTQRGVTQAYVVNFSTGLVMGWGNKTSLFPARLVRGGPFLGTELSVDVSKNTVTDRTTGLMWDRCALGQSSPNCTQGSAT